MHQQVPNLCNYFMKIMKPKIIIYTSLERYFNSAFARSCCIKIHAEMEEKLQVKKIK